MTFIKSISGIRGTIGGSVGEGLSPLDESNCLDVLEKCSKVQNHGQSSRIIFNSHTDIHTLYGLAYARPRNDRKDNCPLKTIELLPFKEKEVWINGLSKEEKEIIPAHHNACSIKR
ncbi:MAG: hypothetical protein WCP85_25140 [Mariniphaga sp.]